MEKEAAPAAGDPEVQEPRRLAILGPGVLGSALAAWAARCGLEVRLAGRDAAQAGKALDRIRRRLERVRGRKDWPEDAVEAASGRITAPSGLEEALSGADCFLEALPEDEGLKKEAWSRVSGLADPGTLLLTGTSSLPLSTLQSCLAGHRGLIGFHLFLPLERMRIVELVTTPGCPELSAARAEALARRLERRVARVGDRPGFAASRMALAQGLEAMRIFESGLVSPEDLDALMVHGYGHPVGPLELSDRIGLDLRLRIAEGIFEATGEEAFRPPPCLRELVARGHLGRKSGRGFLDWTREGDPR